MTRRRYTIESSIRTLARFTKAAAERDISDAMVERVTTSSGDEYHYVVLVATEEVHELLRQQGFINSHTMSSPR